MKTRIFTVIASATLLCLTSGCGSCRQFWFGRGARCGPRCGPIRVFPPAPVVGAPIAAPVVSAPVVSAPVCPTCPQPPVAFAPPPVCGYEVAPPVYAGEPVCGIEAYGGVINDPYLSGEVISDGMIGEGVIGDGVIMGEYPSGSTIPGTIAPDNFDTRGYQSNKFDTDGARIISEQPLPPGVVRAN